MEQKKTPPRAYILAVWFVMTALVLSALYMGLMSGPLVHAMGTTWGAFMMFVLLVFLSPLMMSFLVWLLWTRQIVRGTGFVQSLKKHVAVHRPLGMLPLYSAAILFFLFMASFYEEKGLPGHTVTGIILMMVNAGLAIFALRRAVQGSRALVALMDANKKDAP